MNTKTLNVEIGQSVSFGPYFCATGKQDLKTVLPLQENSSDLYPGPGIQRIGSNSFRGWLGFGELLGNVLSDSVVMMGKDDIFLGGWVLCCSWISRTEYILPVFLIYFFNHWVSHIDSLLGENTRVVLVSSMKVPVITTDYYTHPELRYEKN